MKYYGIDLHSNCMTVAVQELVDGVWRLRTFNCPLYGPQCRIFLDGLQEQDLILVEATTLSFWFYDQVVQRVAACYILNTNRFRRYGNKTDKIDATSLVKILTYNQYILKSRNFIASVMSRLKCRK